MEPELEQFVRDQRDKTEIHETLLLYCRGIDRGIQELSTACFWPDATIDTGILLKRGADMSTGPEWMKKVGCKATMHYLGNHYIELDGDVAYSEAYMQSHMTLEHEGVDHMRVRGSRYIDRWERRDGTWKVASRVVVDDWTRLEPSTEAAAAPYTGKHRGQFGYEDKVFSTRNGVESVGAASER